MENHVLIFIWREMLAVRANVGTHPEFGQVLDEAKDKGVEIVFLTCHVEVDELRGEMSEFAECLLTKDRIGIILEETKEIFYES